MAVIRITEAVKIVIFRQYLRRTFDARDYRKVEIRVDMPAGDIWLQLRGSDNPVAGKPGEIEDEA